MTAWVLKNWLAITWFGPPLPLLVLAWWTLRRGARPSSANRGPAIVADTTLKLALAAFAGFLSSAYIYAYDSPERVGAALVGPPLAAYASLVFAALAYLAAKWVRPLRVRSARLAPTAVFHAKVAAGAAIVFGLAFWLGSLD